MNTSGVIEINATVQWHYMREPEAGRYIGECNALGLVLEASTHEDLAHRIHHAQSLMFQYLLESGELDQFLRQHHWTMHGTIPPSIKDARFELPFDLIREMPNGPTQHAH